jgi:hypothetical protein
MNSRTLKFASFPLEFWQSIAFVVWSCDSAQLSAWLEERWEIRWSKHDGWRGLSLPFKEVEKIEGKPTLIVVLREWSGSNEDVALLSHECYHATRYLHEQLVDSEWHGVEEDAARLMECLVAGCLDALQAG